jgi:hypothetical protein
MTAIELYELQVGLIALGNANIEFWLTATFAVVIAFHFLSGKITKSLYWVSTGLYLYSSLFFLLRFTNVGISFQSFQTLLVSLGYEPYPGGLADMLGLMTYVLYIFGTIACSWYMRKCYRGGT